MYETNELINEYLDYAKYDMLKSDNTVKNYKLDLMTYEKYLIKHEIELLKVDRDIIEQYRRYLLNDIELKGCKKGYAPSTVARHLVSIRTFYDYLINKNYITKNPLEKVKAPKIPKRNPVYLTQKQASKLVLVTNSECEPLKSRDKLMLLMFLTTGLRLDELHNIKLSDITDNAMKVIGKGNKERTIMLNHDILIAIENYLKVRPITKSEYLFVTRTGNQMTHGGIQYTVEKYLEKAKLNKEGLSVHSLRHSAAVMMLEQGIDLRTIQEILGHEKISTTEIYTHISNKRKEQAVQKMNGLLV